MKLKRVFLCTPLFILIMSCSTSYTTAVQQVINQPASYSTLDLLQDCPKRVIPLILPHILDTSMIQVGFHDELRSSVGSMYLDICNNRKGICYAYLIDYYLTGALENKELLNTDYPEETIKNIPGIEYFYHRIFDEAIIVKRDDSGRIVEAPLNPDDLVVIYEQYLTWWRRYRKLPLKKLREQYKKKGGIISFPYTWI